MTLDVETGASGVGDRVRSVLAAAGALTLFCGVDNYGFLAFSGPKPLHWILVVVVATGALAIVNFGRPTPALRSPLLAWVVIFFVITTIWGVPDQSADGVQAFHDRYRSLALLAAFLVLLDRRARRWAALAVAAGVVLSSLV